jgi:DNA polymerase III psi subunit
MIVPTLQRVDDVLEDLDCVAWELDQIAENPGLPWDQIPEAVRKVAQAKQVLSQVLPLVHEIMMPFAREHAHLKEIREALLRESSNACLEEKEPKTTCLISR